MINRKNSSAQEDTANPELRFGMVTDYYRNLSPADKVDLRNRLAVIDNQELIKQYGNRNNFEAKRVLLENITAAKRKMIFDHYIAQLEITVAAMEADDHPGKVHARGIVSQIRQIERIERPENHITKYSDMNLFNVLDSTLKVLQTPILNQDKLVNPAFCHSLDRLTQSRNAIRKDARWDTFFGCVYTVIGLGMLAASATFLALTVIHSAGLTALRLLFNSFVIGFEGYMGTKYAANAFTTFYKCHHSYSLTNKMNALEGVMRQEFQTQQEAPKLN
ncbi:MAG TPA: hypothetical protein VL360_08615 [Gammaproteobacteria bacterium]|jgi:hypothetical protein|nr:hypothetical protein [Gammaproteobacteria bacterium]